MEKDEGAACSVELGKTIPITHLKNLEIKVDVNIYLNQIIFYSS
jgi:hypothetical protein